MSKERQAEIFNMFHDGLLTRFEKKDRNIEFTVYIPYLANLIHEDINTFSGIFVNCIDIFADVFGEERNIVRDIEVLASSELEILTAKYLNDRIEVTCGSTELGKGYGAILVVSAEDILIFDEFDNNISKNELEELCKKYWESYKD